MNEIWLVTIYDKYNEPNIIAFDSKEEAIKCSEYYFIKLNYKRVNIDNIPVYSQFKIKE